MNKQTVVHLHNGTMEYYSGKKKKEPSSHKKTQRNLKKHGEKPI